MAAACPGGSTCCANLISMGNCSAATAGIAACRWADGPPRPPLLLDGKTLSVANYLADAVQVVDAESARLCIRNTSSVAPACFARPPR